MRFVDRGPAPPPACLSARNRGKTELERAREHLREGRKEAFKFAAYKGEEVKRRLEELFHGKCAYCETFYSSGAPVDVEHFRPKGSIAGEDHPGYWWLAMVWENLLPSCIDCNRRRKQEIVDRAPGDPDPAGEDRRRPADSLLELYQTSTQAGKQDIFPIEGTRAQPEITDFTDERALLLNPCVDRPDEHLEFYFGEKTPTSLVLAKTVDLAQVPAAEQDGTSAAHGSVRGATSIQVYGLNRLRLVQDRLRVLRRLEFLETLSIDLASMADEIESSGELDRTLATDIAKRLRDLMERVIGEMKQMARSDAPYSAMAQAWIDRYQRALGGVPD